MPVTIKIAIPDELVTALGAAPENLPRKSLEALIVQAYRKGQITHAEVGEMLEINRWETDEFLGEAQAFRPEERLEFVSDLEDLRRLAKPGMPK
jgi:hypothetical protein